MRSLGHHAAHASTARIRTAVWMSLAMLCAVSPLKADVALASNEYIDRAAFPKGYGILSSDHLMYPVNLDDWPVKIDSRRQLFVDDYLVASIEDLTREFHQPAKHPRNPLIRADRPWEVVAGREMIGLGAVLRDESKGTFRMWYRAGKLRMFYGESGDGVNWRKPDLGLVEHAGDRRNNILIDNGYAIGLIEDKQAAEPQQRYRMIVYHKPPTVQETGFYLYRSADGLRWTGDLSRPILTSAPNPQLYDTVGIGDTSIVRYDPVLARYICDAKVNISMPWDTLRRLSFVPDDENRIRSRAIMESDDLVHWTAPRMTFFPDDRDPPDTQMYGHIGFAYESMWLGLLRVHHLHRDGWKQVEIELSYSRDGRHWSRPAQRQPFIPLGQADSWDPDYSDPAHNGPLLVGDELWFYYSGSRSDARDKKDFYTMCVGLAKLRRDGFVSLNAGPRSGRVVTRPLTFAGRSLFVNAEIQDGGWVKAAVLSAKLPPVEHLRLDDSIPLAKGTTAGRMAWRNADHLPLAGSDHLRLMFELNNAKLYSFWIE